MGKRAPIRVPRQWPKHVKSGVLHAISLASVALACARGHATGRRRLAAQLEQATTEIALLREEGTCVPTRALLVDRREPIRFSIPRSRVCLKSRDSGPLNSVA